MGGFACFVDSCMHSVWRPRRLDTQDSRALTKSLTLASTQGLHRKSLSSNVNHDIARQVLVCSRTWNGCCKIVAELERCVCQCPQLRCPLHYLRNSNGPWRSRRSRVGPDFFSRLERIGLCSEPPTSKKKCVANKQLCIADSTAFSKNILGPLLYINRQFIPCRGPTW